MTKVGKIGLTKPEHMTHKMINRRNRSSCGQSKGLKGLSSSNLGPTLARSIAPFLRYGDLLV